MANYIATVRSNYFAVKDPDAWDEFCDKYEFENIMTWNSERQINLYGFMFDAGGTGLPTHFWDEKEEEYIELDFVADLAQHLEEDEVAIVIEIGREKLRFLGGFAIAVNAKGEQRQVELGEIYLLAEELGKNVTLPED
jgi:hypothetical protein